jgi:hypothetical protein
LILAEIGLVFIIFVLYGAWPVPDSNEAHYLGKMIHYWDPDWCGNDFFFNSDDTHRVFYIAFGWLSLFLSPIALAWVGRIAAWWTLAWAWRRLSWAATGHRWWSVPTAAIMLLLLDRCHMAGEWIVGGLEAKGFAYALVFLGLECLLRNRWNRAWLCLGGASMLHVVLGGWSVIAAGIAWVLLGPGRRPTFRSMLPGLTGGFLLSLPALIPSLLLTSGVDRDLAAQANQIYVFHRLGHHLNPATFKSHFVLRFALLMFAWALVRWKTPEAIPVWRLHCFVAGAIIISMTGIAICYGLAPWPDRAAALLRFYWFRLADVAVPIGIALGTPALAQHWRTDRPRLARTVTVVFLTAALGFIGWNLGDQIAGRSVRVKDPEKSHEEDWLAVCHWIAGPGQIPEDATFLTPRLCRTFKWRTGRAEVVTLKDIPQDPPSIVEWWRRINQVHATGFEPPADRWYESLAAQGEYRLVLLGYYYHARYVLTVTEPRLNLPIVYENESFVVYELPNGSEQRSEP